MEQTDNAKKTVAVTLQVEENMLELVKLVLPRIHGIVSISE